MTLEKASELVIALRKVDRLKSYDLFDHFLDVFKIKNNQTLVNNFAVLCGFMVFNDTK
jgi:hypothetical protein